MSYRRDHWYRPGSLRFTRTYDVWEHLRERLTWAHGHERARAIFEHRDPAARADLAAWRRLGVNYPQIGESRVDDRNCHTAPPVDGA